MNPDLLARFAALTGPSGSVTDPAALAPYLQEPRGHWSGRTSLVLRPASVDEVSAILKLADETKTQIVPQGGNTGLVGGQTPHISGDEIVVSLMRLNRIREFDAESATLTAEAGVILADIQAAAAHAGYLFPLALASQGSCQIGGNLSSNAGGVGALAHGVARDLCLGLEVVLPGGAVFNDLRKLKKDNTGYDLKDLFIGAEGTLGIITAAVLKLAPAPKGKATAWIGLASPEKALALFRQAQAACGPALTAFELVQDRALDFALLLPGAPAAPLAGRHDWHVLFEVSSQRSQDDGGNLLSGVLEAAQDNGLIADAVPAASLGQAAAFWRLRESLSGAQRPQGASIKHDISVPVAAIPAFIAQGAALVEKTAPGARLVCFGHMGDGNLHFNVSQPEGWQPAEFTAMTGDVTGAVHDLVRAFGGSISAEHGIGRMKRSELAATADPTGLMLMHRIKAAFDPNGIMNPGKVL